MTRILTEEFPKGELMERRELHREKVLVIFIRIPLRSLEHSMRKLMEAEEKTPLEKNRQSNLESSQRTQSRVFPISQTIKIVIYKAFSRVLRRLLPQ